MIAPCYKSVEQMDVYPLLGVSVKVHRRCSRAPFAPTHRVGGTSPPAIVRLGKSLKARFKESWPRQSVGGGNRFSQRLWRRRMTEISSQQRYEAIGHISQRQVRNQDLLFPIFQVKFVKAFL
jgi:hypothetical protein